MSRDWNHFLLKGEINSQDFDFKYINAVKPIQFNIQPRTHPPIFSSAPKSSPTTSSVNQSAIPWSNTKSSRKLITGNSLQRYFTASYTLRLLNASSIKHAYSKDSLLILPLFITSSPITTSPTSTAISPYTRFNQPTNTKTWTSTSFWRPRPSYLHHRRLQRSATSNTIPPSA